VASRRYHHEILGFLGHISGGHADADIMAIMRVIGIAGWSGAGKTTLLAKLIPCLTARGLRVSTVKHAHHAFDVDQPGKDSHTHRMAGATEVLVSSANRWALVHELRGSPEPTLPGLLAKLAPADLVIVEGFKHGAHPKLEVYRAAVGKPSLHPDDPHIVAVASDAPVPQARVPVVALDDVDAVADLILARAVPVAALAGCGGSV
jgi:molybdopterin-guanine dinucleotide biosynthesis protein B